MISSTGPHFTSGMDVSAFGSSESAQSDPDPEKNARLRGLRFTTTSGTCRKLSAAWKKPYRFWLPFRAAPSVPGWI